MGKNCRFFINRIFWPVSYFFDPGLFIISVEKNSNFSSFTILFPLYLVRFNNKAKRSKGSVNKSVKCSKGSYEIFEIIFLVNNFSEVSLFPGSNSRHIGEHP